MKKHYTPLRAIRHLCLECMGNSSQRVTICSRTKCPLWVWRFGVRPSTMKEKTPEAYEEEYFIQSTKKHEEEVVGDLRTKGVLEKIKGVLGGGK